MVKRIAKPDAPGKAVSRAVQAHPATQATRRAARAVRKKIAAPLARAVTGTLGLAGERMSKVDTAWLHMDSPSNLMMIVGVMLLQPGLARADLAARVEERLLKYPRFRQRVLEDPAGATWVEDARFDLSHHVSTARLPRHRPGGEEKALQALVAELAMQPLDPKRPLWQFHLIEDYPGADGRKGSALISRIHHCIADGIALISVVLSLVDGGAPPPERRRKPRAGAEDWIADTLIKPFTGLTLKALDAGGEGVAQSLALLANPQQGLEKGLAGGLDIARMAYQGVSDIAALALMSDDSKTRLKGKPGTAKRVAWCAPLPLEDVKAVGKALGCSINDVLLSCVAGAIGVYLSAKGDDTEGQEIRAMVPVNLRPLDQAWKLGNRFGLAPLVLPIGIQNPVERVYEVRRRMQSLKGSFQPLLAFALLAVAGLLIKPAQDAMLGLFGRKTTAVMTNVPGPRERLRLAGSEIGQIMFWVPQSGDVGMGVSILSYGGGVQFGLITDSTLCPDPQAIIDAFEPEFGRLALLALMLPWE